jgi:hypothetical protein
VVIDDHREVGVDIEGKKISRRLVGGLVLATDVLCWWIANAVYKGIIFTAQKDSLGILRARN